MSKHTNAKEKTSRVCVLCRQVDGQLLGVDTLSLVLGVSIDGLGLLVFSHLGLPCLTPYHMARGEINLPRIIIEKQLHY